MSCAVNGSSHALMDIYSGPSGDGPGIVDVVRWCCNCGAVVVDVDVDGRTQPGRRVAMQFPRLARQAATAPKGP